VAAVSGTVHPWSTAPTAPQRLQEPFTGYVLRLGGGQVLLGNGQAVLDVLRALQKVQADYRVNAAPTPARVQYLIEALQLSLADSASSEPGSAEYRIAALLPSSDKRVGVGEAAVLLGVSARRVRYVAEELGGRKLGRSWVFDRDELEEFARQRAAEKRVA